MIIGVDPTYSQLGIFFPEPALFRASMCTVLFDASCISINRAWSFIDSYR